MKSSTKKAISAAQKAIHKQKKLSKFEVNRMEQSKTPRIKFFLFLQDWFLEVEKKWRNR